MEAGVVIQARMSSRRLPGKVLRDLAGKPLLEHLLDGLSRAGGVAGLIVATSTEPSDDPIAEYCRARGQCCVRGDLHDVASRFARLAETTGWDALVRVSGDSPLLDHRLVERAIAVGREAPFDVVTNVFPRTYPSGQSVELIHAAAMRRAHAGMSDPFDREHVTPIFYRGAERWRVRNFSLARDASDIDMAVDTDEGFRRVERFLTRLDRPRWQYTCEELVDMYRHTPGERAERAA